MTHLGLVSNFKIHISRFFSPRIKYRRRKNFINIFRILCFRFLPTLNETHTQEKINNKNIFLLFSIIFYCSRGIEIRMKHVVFLSDWKFHFVKYYKLLTNTLWLNTIFHIIMIIRVKLHIPFEYSAFVKINWETFKKNHWKIFLSITKKNN